jgi:fibronectin type 3 domain-containing protein
MTASDTIKLEWSAPETRLDEELIELYEIDSYVIYYGSNLSKLSNSITIDSAEETEYVLAGLDAGTYYFVITTIDTEGLQSENSEPVTITL